jgi:hypothetical protein
MELLEECRAMEVFECFEDRTQNGDCCCLVSLACELS